MIGMLKEWIADRAYGWIAFNNGRQIFSHITDWSNLEEVPTVGQVVEFDIAENKHHPGRRKAINVRVASQNSEVRQ